MCGSGDDVTSIVDIETLERVIYDSVEYSTEEEDDIVDLHLMNAEDVLLNHPTLILKLGLVEVLKVMVEKGFIPWMSLTHVITTAGVILFFGEHIFIHPILHALTILLSRPESDCSQRWDG